MGRRSLSLTAASLASCLFATCLFAPAAHAAEVARPSPPGPHAREVDRAQLAKTAFRAEQPIVGTYYFYWYDAATREHFTNGDGTDALTHHPLVSQGYSYRSPDWHRRELLDILAAGLDFILPVYWGSPGDHGSWSFAGLPPLVEACRRLEGEGKTPPRIGLFYDTSTLQWNSRGYHADLTTLEGKEWLYVSARDFFSLIPPDLWATVEGRPIVWLYSAGFARRQDPTALDHLRRAFEADFGVRPFVVKEVSWHGEADAAYAWGAALRPTVLGVAAVGPGYDHSAVPGRTPLVRDREGGAFYSRSWEWALSRSPASRPKIAVVETWNELHEGTEIAPTREHGRRYVDLTRKHADLWRAGARLERSGPFGKAREVTVLLGARHGEEGLRQVDLEDGVTAPVREGGKEGRTTAPSRHGGRYIYFDADDSFFFDEREALEVEFEYLDRGKGAVVLEYDSTDRAALLDGSFKAAAPIPLGGTGEWRTAAVKLPDPAFTGRANGADFRLSAPEGDLVLSRVTVRKAGR